MAAASKADLLAALNARWIASHLAADHWISLVWLVNTEFTKLGIGPRWRGLPRWQKTKPPRLSGILTGTTRAYYLDHGTQLNNLMRWVDLEWLRAVLGPHHVTKGYEYTNATHENLSLAQAAWSRLNRIAKTSSADAGASAPHRVLDGLKVPKLTRVSLTGLIDKDTANRVTVAMRRIESEIEPKLNVWAKGRPSGLAEDEVAHRLRVAEAIELAQGSPKDAADVLRWMTGRSVTRQAVNTMRLKMASQLGLTRQYWT